MDADEAAALRRRADDLRLRLHELLVALSGGIGGGTNGGGQHVQLRPPSAADWPTVLEQLSVVSVQLASLHESLNVAQQQAAVYPATADCPLELPELLRSKLLPDMERRDAHLLQSAESRGAPVGIDADGGAQRNAAIERLIQAYTDARESLRGSAPRRFGEPREVNVNRALAGFLQCQSIGSGVKPVPLPTRVPAPVPSPLKR